MSLAPLYAILDVDLACAAGHSPEDLCAAWGDAGIRLIQLRAKRMASGELLALATRLSAIVSDGGGMFIVNDRADIARLSGAAGVHVGQDDLSPESARAVVGIGSVVGVSTHNLEQAARALGGPVDYIAIGPVFETTSKERPDAVVGVDGLARVVEAARASRHPVVAIGGITIDHLPSVFAAGAASVAMISALLVGDPGERARELMHAVSSARHARTTS